MKSLMILLLLLSNIHLNAQISHGGSPFTINQSEIDIIPSVITEPDDKVIRENKPKYFIFGDEYNVNLDYFSLAESYPTTKGDIFVLRIQSPGAKAIGLEMSDFYLSEGTKMFIYSEDGEVILGSFTSDNNNEENIFSTSVVKGDNIFIEVYEPEGLVDPSRIHIRKIIHDFTDIMGYYAIDDQDRNSCNPNVACPEADLWWDQVNAVLRMTMGGGMCSGSLINNVECDLTPYVFTADHCVEGTTPGYHVYLFRYQAATCSGNTGPTIYSLNGATLRANGSGPDYALLELYDEVPGYYNPYYNGWNRSDNTPTNPVGIHHPGGEIKKISLTSDIVTPGYYYWIFEYDLGRIYPGSSGSPLFDQSHRTIGVASYMTTDYCYGYNCYCYQQYDAGYGRFDRSWNYGSLPLKTWLDPNDTGVNYIDGSTDCWSGEIAIITPNGGEEWETGTEQNILWSDNYESAVSIKLYKSDNYVTTLETSTASDGSYIWEISDALVPDDDYSIKITSVEDESVYDVSNEYFSLTGESSDVIVSIGNIYPAEQLIDIHLVSNIPIAGYQFDLNDNPNLINIEDAFGGITEDNEFTISTNSAGTILAFSLIGYSIPPGDHLLTRVNYSIIDYEQTELCLQNGIFSSVDGLSLPVIYGDCVNLQLLSDLAGDVNLDGIIDILDIIGLINEILMPGQFDDNQFAIADLNNDGFLNILDVVSIVNIILM